MPTDRDTKKQTKQDERHKETIERERERGGKCIGMLRDVTYLISSEFREIRQKSKKKALRLFSSSARRPQTHVNMLSSPQP